MSLHQYIPAFEPIEFIPLPDSCTDKYWNYHQDVLDNYKLRLATLKESANTDSDALYILESIPQSLTALTHITQNNYQQLIDCINGKSDQLPEVLPEALEGHLLSILCHDNVSLLHLLRLEQLKVNPAELWRSEYGYFELGSLFHTTELRQMAQAFERFGFKHIKLYFAEQLLDGSNTYKLDYYDDLDLVWPFFAENIEYLEEALGVVDHHQLNKYFKPNPRSAMRILNLFPVLPEQFIPVLKEDALSGKKSVAPQAQKRLGETSTSYAFIAEGLTSSKQDVRLSMAQWLTQLQSPQAQALIEQQLGIEKREIVKAVLLTALEKQGADISPYLNPAQLLKEAEKGLKSKAPVSMEWFKLAYLPKLHWQDGSEVAASIVQWWVVLAVKLKEPSSEGLLQRYLGLLSPTSQQQLGMYILQSYIQEDTRGPSYEEASNEAAISAQQTLSQYQNYYTAQQLIEYGISLESLRQQQIKHIMQRYAGSASDAKGMLALISEMDGLTVVPIVQSFAKQHYTRRSSIDGMLTALASKDDIRTIQWIIHEARNNRTAAIRSQANSLVQAIAERKQWNDLELQDRTIATAGLDETGMLTLDYDTRELTAKLNDNYEFVLYTPEGKTLKTLPSPRKLDDAERIKETKKTFSVLKQELKDTVLLQSQRLENAAVSARQWLVSDWQRDYLQHPIMRLLIQRIIWLVMDGNTSVASFRPTEDGSLVNLNDDEIQLAPTQFISVAHSTLLSEQELQAWRQHFVDYKVTPLFDQLSQVLPADLDLNQIEINNQQNQLIDSFEYIDYLDGQNYEHNSQLYHGTGYTLKAENYDLYAHITVSNIHDHYTPTLLGTLQFFRKNAHKPLPLSAVARPFLARCYADYQMLASFKRN